MGKGNRAIGSAGEESQTEMCLYWQQDLSMYKIGENNLGLSPRGKHVVLPERVNREGPRSE